LFVGLIDDSAGRDQGGDDFQPGFVFDVVSGSDANQRSASTIVGGIGIGASIQ